jgi:hypothetical protein
MTKYYIMAHRLNQILRYGAKIVADFLLYGFIYRSGPQHINKSVAVARNA